MISYIYHCLCMFIRVQKEKWLELSSPQSVEILSMAGGPSMGLHVDMTAYVSQNFLCLVLCTKIKLYFHHQQLTSYSS